MKVALFTLQPLELGGGWERFLINYGKCHTATRPLDQIAIISVTDSLFHRLTHPFMWMIRRSHLAYVQNRIDPADIYNQCSPVDYHRCNSLDELLVTLSNFDVIYSKNEFLDLLFLRYFHLRTKVPVIVGTHCAQYYPNPERSYFRSFRNFIYVSLLYDLTSRFVGAWHVLNSESRSYVQRWHATKPIATIPYPYVSADRSRTSKSQPQPPARSDETVRILWAGRLTQQKGYRELADIINSLSISNSASIQWLIAGSGEDHEQVHRLLGTSPSVHFLGHVSHGGVLDLMNASDIFLSTSIWESWPNVINEALDSGIIIVASDIPGHSDMLVNQPHSYLYQTTGHALSILTSLFSKKLERRDHWLPAVSNSRIVDRMYDELFSHFE